MLPHSQATSRGFGSEHSLISNFAGLPSVVATTNFSAIPGFTTYNKGTTNSLQLSSLQPSVVAPGFHITRHFSLLSFPFSPFASSSFATILQSSCELQADALVTDSKNMFEWKKYSYDQPSRACCENEVPFQRTFQLPSAGIFRFIFKYVVTRIKPCLLDTVCAYANSWMNTLHDPA